jgi:hypothetical protein
VKSQLVCGSALLLLSGCSSDGFAQPKASAFAAGSCRDMAAPVLALGKTLHGLGEAPPTTRQRDDLKAYQGLLRKVTPDSALATAYDDLVQNVGLVRLRADSNSYDRSVAQAAFTSYDVLVRACTA